MHTTFRRRVVFVASVECKIIASFLSVGRLVGFAASYTVAVTSMAADRLFMGKLCVVSLVIIITIINVTRINKI